MRLPRPPCSLAALSTLSLAVVAAFLPGPALAAPARSPPSLAALAVSAASAEAPAAPLASEARAAPRVLRVSGVGRVGATPDVALVTFSVTTFDRSLAVATREASARAKKLVEVLRATVAAADLATQAYDVQIERREEKPGGPVRVVGYRVTNALRARVRELAQLGPLLDRAVAAGANEVQGLELGKDDLRAETQRALAAAVRDARGKADEMARASGVTLGELVELTEAVDAMPMQRTMFAAKAAMESVPVQPGELSVEARVQAVYALR